MNILLPPSEGKTPSPTGPALDLSALSLPDLHAHRREVLDELAAVSAHPDALRLLGVGARLAEDVERNTRLWDMACSPALLTYTGVLYAALDAQSLSASAASRLDSVWVSSAVFGMVRATDPIPAYRLAMKTRLGDLGVMATWWRTRLGAILDEEFSAGLVLDCRSADYRRSWPGPVDRTVQVNVFTETAGQRTVVSHNAKHTRGELVGRLLRSDRALPNTHEDLLHAAQQWYTADLTPPAGRTPAQLDIILQG